MVVNYRSLRNGQFNLEQKNTPHFNQNKVFTYPDSFSTYLTSGEPLIVI